MYWGYMTFNDETEVTYSETDEGGTCGVWVETPIDGGFKSAHCNLPSFKWDSVEGFDDEELSALDVYIKNNALLIMEMSEEKTADAMENGEIHDLGYECDRN